MKNNNFDYNEEIKKCKTIDDVMGKNGLIQKLDWYFWNNITD